MNKEEPNIPEKLLKPYDPAETEGRIYDVWEKDGYFNPDNLPERHAEPFTIIMPPPNANGSLHVGHAVFVTIEDLMIRYKRMQGFKTLWLPGADHAGFETQIVYEKKLEKEGRSRFKMDPDQLRDEIMEFTQSNKTFMEEQIRQLGASCDWSRETFTLDPKIIKTVGDTFKQLFDDGLLYRAKRPVNWCTKHQTSLSELETSMAEKTDKLYYIKYGPFTVATVRPETIFGDVAIAVHPDDPRYKEYINTTITVKTPIGEMDLVVVGDDYVDMEFGTGALKITPAHDKNDFEMAKRHELPSIEVIDRYGRLTEKAGKYTGMKILPAREAVANDLQEMGLLEKVEDYKHEVPTCYKCPTVIEPRLMNQWYVKTKPLAAEAMKAVENGDTTFVSERFRKTFFHWMNNIEDWNISRQIVWGIPIPAKICTNATCEEGVVDLDDNITECPHCGGKVEQDPDTFDTWFSSGQWPFATLGYPDKDDFKTYYPTDVMETAADILFFWVARMIMLGIYRTGKTPFKTVYLHGLVRDKNGKKMSKSKGNVVSPIEMTEKYGTDALRMALIVGNTPGNDMAISEEKIKGYKHFANKLWNISRFVSEQTVDAPTEVPKITDADQELLAEVKELTDDISREIENYHFYLAGEKLYHYTWDRFAATILEESKEIMAGSDAEAIASRKWVLKEILYTIIKLLHPFMPFITEELWGLLHANETPNPLIIESWPKL